MKIYFLSSQPCALTVNGAFYGITDSFERFAELSLSDRLYVQFSPQGALPLGFFITEELRTTPPSGCEVYLLKDGLAVYARDFSPADLSLRPVAQAREGDVLATLFFQGKLQLSVESQKGLFTATIPPSFASASLSFYRGFIVVNAEGALGIYTDEATPLLIEKVIDHSFDGSDLRATLPLSDRLQRTAKCRWTLSENGCTLQEFSLQQSSENGEPPEGLLAYAFFESVLLRANFADFLSDELRPEAEQIAKFLGDFCSVTLTEESNTCGLVYKRGENLYEVVNYLITVENGKITDVRG